MNITKGDLKELQERIKNAEQKIELIGEIISVYEAAIPAQEVRIKIAAILKKTFRKKGRNVLGCIIAHPSAADPSNKAIVDAVVGGGLEEFSDQYIRTITSKIHRTLGSGYISRYNYSIRGSYECSIREFDPSRSALAMMLLTKSDTNLGMIVIVAEGKQKTLFDKNDLALLNAVKRYLELVFAQHKMIY